MSNYTRTAKEIVEKEVARQAKFGMEPSWEDFVLAGITESKKEESIFLDKILHLPFFEFCLQVKERKKQIIKGW